MWLFAMFDLPVTTKKARKRYARFRKLLLEQGFSMLQYSVYARYCAGEEIATRHRHHIRAALPPEGYVRLLAVTDRQFGKMESYIGKSSEPPEEAPAQLTLF
ncbi:MAG TPA: CRISPR-associated endonuclease Cas2 [Thermoguttaceae bacterium]|nr:CRISPR-associated endonuclease Cas2 [Thermoguttaceae bacterium]